MFFLRLFSLEELYTVTIQSKNCFFLRKAKNKKWNPDKQIPEPTAGRRYDSE